MESERMLRDTISVVVTHKNRLVSQQMTPVQYRRAGSLVRTLLTQVREEYRGIVSKLESLFCLRIRPRKRIPPFSKQLRSFLHEYCQG